MDVAIVMLAVSLSAVTISHGMKMALSSADRWIAIDVGNPSKSSF